MRPYLILLCRKSNASLACDLRYLLTDCLFRHNNTANSYLVSQTIGVSSSCFHILLSTNIYLAVFISCLLVYSRSLFNIKAIALKGSCYSEIPKYVCRLGLLSSCLFSFKSGGGGSWLHIFQYALNETVKL